MPIPPESIEVGKCYLTDRRETSQVWRIVATFPDGRLEYQHRSADPAKKQLWRTAMTTVLLFVGAVTREVPATGRLRGMGERANGLAYPADWRIIDLPARRLWPALRPYSFAPPGLLGGVFRAGAPEAGGSILVEESGKTGVRLRKQRGVR